jgi:beta-galactosidase
MNSDVWLNGKHLGNRPYGYSSFQYELTPYLKFGNEKNILAVRADVQQPCSRWYSGAGIYRHVRLTVTDPIHIAQWGTYVTTPQVSDKEATVRVETKIQNQSNSVQQVMLETVIVENTGTKVTKSRSMLTVKPDSICVWKIPYSIALSPKYEHTA